MIDFKFFEDAVNAPGRMMSEYIKKNKKIIGCFPLYIPEQIVYALDMIPFGMWGSEREVTAAKNYFPAYVCGILQTNFELAIRGAYDGISAVMITTLCDSLKCATQNWKYAVPGIEVIPVNYPQNRSSRGAYSFLYAQYKGIIERLEEISGQKLEQDSLKEAIEVYNEHNAVMREFIQTAAAYPKEITPFNRSCVIKSGYFMDKKEHTKAVKQLICEIKKTPPQRFRGIRVVTTGIIADSKDLLEIFHQNKISVAADDIAHESRQFRIDVKCGEDKDPVGALVNQYLEMYGCSTVIGGSISREEHILNLAEQTNADGVIMLMTKFCDPEEYDYPVIKEMLEKRKIPLLSIEVDKQVRNYGQAATALQTFQEMIRL